MYDLLFADNTAFVAHCAKDLQTLLSQFSSDFSLIINLNKTEVLIQGTDIPPTIKTNVKDVKN